MSSVVAPPVHDKPSRWSARRRPRPTGTVLVVCACAVVAALARVPAIGWSAGPDESGFTLVARAWDPSAESPYGPYWVDRPPLLIALVRLTDALAGVHGIRWVAMAGCALLVLAAAGVAREVALTGAPDARARTVVLTAVGTTALVSNPSIDLVYAKGEVLSLPLLVGSTWLVLRAVRTGSSSAAALSGLLAGTALGLKQNLVGAICFGVLLLVGEGLRRMGPVAGLVRLGGAFLVGAMVPLLLTIGWALGEGVNLSALWDAVFGFRADALDVLLAGPLGESLGRAAHLVAAAFSTGLVLLLLWFLLSLRRLGRERPVLTVATLGVVAVDSATLVLGGSYWLPYLFGLVPAAVLCLALLASGTPATDHRPARSRVVTGTVVGVMVAGCTVSAVDWVGSWPGASRLSTAVLIGRSIASAAQAGDTLTVWGGRADLQLASGMPSPYEHLWSLPARTRDPRGQRLAAVLQGPSAPTWLVTWADTDAWDGAAAAVDPVLRHRYVKVATACGGREVYRLRDRPRTAPQVTCRELRTMSAATDG